MHVIQENISGVARIVAEARIMDECQVIAVEFHGSASYITTVHRAIHAIVALAPAWRWLIWAGYVVAWTVSLLVPKPIHAGDDAVLAWWLFIFAKTVHVTAYALFAI